MDEGNTVTASALFLTASLFNLRVAPTLYRRYADLLFVRAARDIAKGSEILISYVQDLHMGYGPRPLERHMGPQSCLCELCQGDRELGPSKLRARHDLNHLEGVLAEECDAELRKKGTLGREDRNRYNRQFRDFLLKHEKIYPITATFRPFLLYSNRYIASLLGAQDDPSQLLVSVNHAIAVLVCIVFKPTDTSPVTIKDVASAMMIDFSQSHLHYAYNIAPPAFHSIVRSLEKLRLPKRKESWLRTFKKMEEILSGGGDAFFEAQHKKQLESKIAVYYH